MPTVRNAGPPSGKAVGYLGLTVPASSKSFSASLRLGSETVAMAWTGALVWDTVNRRASAQVSRLVSGVSFELGLSLSLFGELEVTVKRNAVLVAQASDGIRLLSPSSAQKQASEGAYTLVLNPPTDAAANIPAGSGWATARIASNGRMSLVGRLADNSSLTANLEVDVAEKPGYRLFVQPYNRRDSYLGGRLALEPHAEYAGEFRATSSDLDWVKASSIRDLTYRLGFATELEASLEPWQVPNATQTLPSLLGLVTNQPFGVEHSATGSASHAVLPSQLALGSSNVISVLTPVSNPRRWRMTMTPGSGAFSGSYELMDGTEVRRISFGGVLRQVPTSNSLIGAGFFLLPPLKAAGTTEQTSGAILLRRP